VHNQKEPLRLPLNDLHNQKELSPTSRQPSKQARKGSGGRDSGRASGRDSAAHAEGLLRGAHDERIAHQEDELRRRAWLMHKPVSELRRMLAGVQVSPSVYNRYASTRCQYYTPFLVSAKLLLPGTELAKVARGCPTPCPTPCPTCRAF
jgi:hypothetical protein